MHQDRLSCLLADPTGFEPALSALTGPHVGPLHHGSPISCGLKFIIRSWACQDYFLKSLCWKCKTYQCSQFVPPIVEQINARKINSKMMPQPNPEQEQPLPKPKLSCNQSKSQLRAMILSIPARQPERLSMCASKIINEVVILSLFTQV